MRIWWEYDMGYILWFKKTMETTTNGPFAIAIAMLDYHGVYGI